ncbi:proton-conducting transporter membrane subunit [Nesterenkonia lutea]|uniref:Formate hydrogenlyase subunit 3/multisubunit Na+/H+ antiporter MnhD subunit n=1 Tax=Nesterenkonia lutea TaxID=272919 RepID=A0ABR9JGV5_9MICC|nr:proton-conducting transporter membrane subunit [Nesterenkonia lutea]MBE1525160.1 formate hydrogenlyase subunit 3/multisubunit Na+/H+ antiporter MnhD subunit [Nesterenkonia lutea]
MLIALSLLLPLVTVLGLTLTGLLRPAHAFLVRRRLSLLAPLTVLPAVLLALLAGSGAETVGSAEETAGSAATLDVPWLLFGAHFAVDLYARPLLLVAALLYGAALTAVSWVRRQDSERGAGGLSAFLLLSYVGNIGTYIAADAVSFYTSFALMSFSAAGLVIHHRTPTAQRATRIYLVMSVLSETAILAALLLIVAAGGFMLDDAADAAGTAHTGLIQALLFLGLGVKAGTVPLHVWLPLAHPAAPPAASAVLSGAMVNAGLIGWIRFLPEGARAGEVLLTLALIGAFAAVVLGVLQHDPKVILAYSTVSQLGFMTALIAVGLLDPALQGATSAAVVLYAAHHGLAKGALFLGVPVVRHFGHGRARLPVLVGMLGAGLAVAGAPWTSGAFGKYVSKEAVGEIGLLGVGLGHLLPLVATGSTLLLLRFAVVMFSAERAPRSRPDGELLSWLAVCAAGIAVPWVIGVRWVVDVAEEEKIKVPTWDASTLWGAVWPILLGLVLSGLAFAAARRRRSPARRSAGQATQVPLVPLVPPGDLLGAEERIIRGIRSSGGTVLTRTHRFTADAAARWVSFWAGLTGRLRQGISAGENRLSGWESTGLALVALLTGVVLISIILLGRVP